MLLQKIPWLSQQFVFLFISTWIALFKINTVRKRNEKQKIREKKEHNFLKYVISIFECRPLLSTILCFKFTVRLIILWKVAHLKVSDANKRHEVNITSLPTDCTQNECAILALSSCLAFSLFLTNSCNSQSIFVCLVDLFFFFYARQLCLFVFKMNVIIALREKKMITQTMTNKILWPYSLRTHRMAKSWKWLKMTVKWNCNPFFS